MPLIFSSLLKYAALANASSAILNRLKNGDHIDGQDNEGFTVLMYASKKGNLEAVNLLIENGANPFLTNKYGKNSSDLALLGGHHNLVEVFTLHEQKKQTYEPNLFEEEALDLSNWVEEKDVILPIHQNEIIENAKLTFEIISDHISIDDDMSWMDVEINLPENGLSEKDLRNSYDQQKIILINDCENCLSWGVKYGFIPKEWVDKIFVEIENSEALKHCFFHVLNELYIYINEENYFSYELPPYEILSYENELDSVSEALKYFKYLIEEDTSAIGFYMREIKQFNLISKEEEIEIAKEIEAGLMEALGALSTCPFIINEILEYASQIEKGTLDVGSLIERLIDVNDLGTQNLSIDVEESQLGDDHIEDSDDEDYFVESVSPTLEKSSDRIEKLKKISLEKFTVIRSQFGKMQNALDRDGFDSESYVKAQSLILNELLGFRFTAKTVDRLCDSVRSQVNQVWATERALLNILVDKIGVPRAEVLAGIQKNTTNLRWTTSFIKDGKPYISLLERNIPAIHEMQQKLIDMQNRVILPLTQLKKVHKKMTAGHKRAIEGRRKMIVANLRLVIPICRRYSNRGIEFSDLIQEANIGLMKAVDKFDYRRGYKFSTYATWWIRQAVSRYVQDSSRQIRIPVHAGDLMYKIYQIEKSLINVSDSKINNQIALIMNVPVEKIINTRKQVYTMISLESEEDTDIEILNESQFNIINSSNDYENNDLRLAFERIFENMLPKEREVIKFRFGWEGEEHTLEEIGQKFGVTRERIRQIEKKAFNTLKKPSSLREIGYKFHDSHTNHKKLITNT